MRGSGDLRRLRRIQQLPNRRDPDQKHSILPATSHSLPLCRRRNFQKHSPNSFQNLDRSKRFERELYCSGAVQKYHLERIVFCWRGHCKMFSCLPTYLPIEQSRDVV